MKLLSISLFILLFSSQAFSRTTFTCYGTNQKNKKVLVFQRTNRADIGDDKSLYLTGLISAANKRGPEFFVIEIESYNNRKEVYSNAQVNVEFDKNLKTVVVTDLRKDEPNEYYTNVMCREIE